MKRLSLSQKFAAICAAGKLSQLHISDIDPVQMDFFAEYIAKGYFIFSFSPFDTNIGKFVQAVKNPSEFIKNAYSMCIA